MLYSVGTCGMMMFDKEEELLQNGYHYNGNNCMVLMFTVLMKWEQTEKSIEGSFILIGVSFCFAKLKHG